MTGRDYGRVAVVMGGESAERRVSLDGGADVLKAMRAQGVDAEAVDGIPALIEQIQAGRVDRVFNLLHGRGGEDGEVQGVLRALNIPCTGSGILGSALSMDKVWSKRVFNAHALPTPEFRTVTTKQWNAGGCPKFSHPVFVKPAREGSSVGLAKVLVESEFAPAIDAALKHDETVLIEALIDGGEYTVAILQGQALPAIRIEPDGEFYDYHAKYESDNTQYHIPCGLDPESESLLAELARQAFDALGCSGWGRVDFMVGRREGPQVIEVNTTPGMTSHSLVPKAAAAAGIDYGAFVLRVLDTSFEETQA